MAESQTGGAYRVLARKYRPQTFTDLIGQEPMVRTLANSFAAGRIHHAYIFTGVRGTGKTTTARILARGLNFEPMEAPDGAEPGGQPGGPTIHMPTLGRHCQAIMESRHVDVIEMDAASNTGINDIREIIENSRYRPVSARYKVFIIDEVHMLSTAAFNGLLKTLEEPPAHVKFLFATTEIRKVPVTVLSRCIRFDLRRIESGMMMEHLSGLCAKENVSIDDEALAMIARASEGSVRDAQSLLDQAIAHGSTGGETKIQGEDVRAMLGLADRGRVIDLFEAVMKGDMAFALAEVRSQYDSGADPATVLGDLADYVHSVTRLKLIPASSRDPSLSEQERVRGEGFAAALSMRVLTRAWQILLKGLQEVAGAPRPLPAAEMVLVRLAYAADLPTPDEALRALKDEAGPREGAPRHGGGGSGSGGSASAAPRGSYAQAGSRPMLATSSPEPQIAAQPQPAAPAMVIASVAQLAEMAAERRDIGLKVALERDVRPVRLEPGIFEFALAPGGSRDLPARISRALQEWTGARWMVAISSEDGAATLQELADARREEAERGVRAHPTVRAILAKFPGAEIVDVRLPKAENEAEQASSGAAADEPDLVGPTEPDYTDDDL